MGGVEPSCQSCCLCLREQGAPGLAEGSGRSTQSDGGEAGRLDGDWLGAPVTKRDKERRALRRRGGTGLRGMAGTPGPRTRLGKLPGWALCPSERYRWGNGPCPHRRGGTPPPGLVTRSSGPSCYPPARAGPPLWDGVCGRGPRPGTRGPFAGRAAVPIPCWGLGWPTPPHHPQLPALLLENQTLLPCFTLCVSLEAACCVFQLITPPFQRAS